MYKRRMAEADLSLNFDCPTCGAAPQEVCELNSGTPRFASHAERWDIAKEYQPKAKANVLPPPRKAKKKGSVKPRGAAKSK